VFCSFQKMMLFSSVLCVHKFNCRLVINEARYAMYALRNVTARSCNHGCRRKAISVTYSESVCSLRYPARNAHAPYCHLWPSPLYIIFPHCLIKGTIFGGKKLLNINCPFSLSLRLSETFLFPRKTERDIIKTYSCLQVKYP